MTDLPTDVAQLHGDPTDRDAGKLALWPELVAMVKRLEWSDQDDDCSFGCCPDCGSPEYREHRPSCELAALLARARELK
jgi:hypothetical protein